MSPKNIYTIKRISLFFLGLLLFVGGFRWILISLEKILLIRESAGPLAMALVLPLFSGLIIGTMIMYYSLGMKFKRQEEIL